MDMNEKTALLADLKACNAYENGEAAAAAISQPTICVLAGKDRMTPLKAGQAMAAAIKDAAVEIIADAGHFLPAEAPFEVNKSLTRFLQ